jgi:hypothetical protein
MKASYLKVTIPEPFTFDSRATETKLKNQTYQQDLAHHKRTEFKARQVPASTRMPLYNYFFLLHNSVLGLKSYRKKRKTKNLE